MVTQVTNAVRGRQTINPRTVLGFFATVLGILLAGTSAVVGFLVTSKVQTELVPIILAFAGGTFLLLIIAVFVVTLVDPSKLMLTQVTGTEYAAIQQHTVIGDSVRGETAEVILDSVPITADSVISLPSGEVSNPSEPPPSGEGADTGEDEVTN